ncbi:MAG: lipopolysaccharide kinase InaA family protein [Planctomycetota bacterium]
MSAALEPRDRQVVDRWFEAFVRDGRVPDELTHVQGRLIRAVHRAALPSGEVFVKTMTFPRAKDRLRYAFRALPAAHEAWMLRATAMAGIPCPEVVAVRTRRRLGLPHRSMLVVRALDVAGDPEPAERRAPDEVRLAMRLLQAGIRHRDLHGENFVRLRSGALAVLDLQSVSISGAERQPVAEVRLATASRLLRDRHGAAHAAALAAMRDCGMLCSDAELTSVAARIEAERARYERSRIRRCMQTSTQFERSVHWSGVRHRLRDAAPDGRWIRGGAELRDAWIGQRVRQLREGAPLPFGAFFQKWWWLGGGAALYVPRACSDERIEAEVRTASAATRGPSPERPAQSGRSE